MEKVIIFTVGERIFLSQILDNTPSKGMDATRLQQKAFEETILNFDWRARIERFDAKSLEETSLQYSKESTSKALEVVKQIIETNGNNLPHWQSALLMNIHDKLFSHLG